MFQESISPKIAEFLKTEKERTKKIDCKIDALNINIQKIKTQISDLEDICVKYDLEDDITEKLKANKLKAEKEIASLRRDIENLEGQRAAYERARAIDNKSIDKALIIKKEAAAEVAKVEELFRSKVNDNIKLEDEILKIQEKIRNSSAELEYLRNYPETIASQLLSIETFIYGNGALEERCKADASGWNTKTKLILSDLRNM